MTHKITYRRARLEDLLPAFRTVMFSYNHLLRKHSMKPERMTTRELPAIPRHLYETDTDSVWCAWKDDRIVGYAHALNRGKQWYLAYLFVHPQVQDKGIGRKLLEHVWRDEPGVTHSLCTFSYNPQAIGIYSQFGMSPAMDLPRLSCAGEWLRKPRRPGLVVSEQFGAKDFLWLDRLEDEIRGYRRPQEWHLWTTHPEFKAYLFIERGKRIGYAVIYKEIFVGPVGAISPAALVKVTAELLHVVPSGKDHAIKCNLAGSNLALYQMLIKSGFRCDEVAVFMTDKSYVDFDRYVPTHLAIF